MTASPETLWIQGRRIAEPSASPEQRADLQRVDATGLYLIPGLIDSYCYFDAGQAALYTAAGVLTLFDHGGDPGRVLDARAHAASPSSPMPEIRSAIAVLDGDPPAAPLSAVVRSAHDVEHQVRLLRESEADFLAFQAGIGVEPWRRLLELAAHPEPLPAEPDKEPVVLPPLLVFGPLPRAATLDDVLQHKGHGLVFLDAFLPAGKHWDELELADFDRSPLQERIAKAGAARQAIVPALRALARLLEDPARQAFTLDHLDPRWSALWSSELAGRKVTITSAERQRLERALSVQRELVRRLDAAGARLVPGSGAPHAWLAPGRGLIDELQEWERAGIAPARALELATSAAAKVWQRSDLGTLSAGSLASVVALRKDPSLSSAALAEVEFVIVRGKLLTRADLEQRLEQLREENTRQRAALGAPLSIPAPEQPEGTVLISGYSETQSSVGRLAGERWSVVREPSGALAFCGRRYRPSAGPAMG